MFDLYLLHGRNDPAENLDDWGFSGPRLSGVLGIHQTYCSEVTVVFATPADAQRAQEATGWEAEGHDRLRMPFIDDLVRCGTGGAGACTYFGDWGLILPADHLEAAERQRNALRDAVRFVEGFEGDELQSGIDGPHGLLARLRAANDAAWHVGDPAATPRKPAPADPLADLAPDLRARLVDQLGFVPEMMGGGVYGLFSRSSGGGFVLVTGSDGGLPAPDNWGVGAYLASDTDSAVLFMVEEPEAPTRNPLTIFAAVEAALSAVAEMEGH